MAEKQLSLDFREDAPEPEKLLPLLSPDDIYRRAESMLALLGEDRRIERKPAKMHARSLGEYFSMWANTSPDGRLIAFGVADDGQIQGCRSLDPKTLNRIEGAGTVYCPEARYDSRRIPAVNANGEPDLFCCSGYSITRRAWWRRAITRFMSGVPTSASN